ncbi:pleckstrin homology domain-containing family A member 4 isoform X2 [Salarias fasciatus]|uniref:pleckstrin homology domain-containing family A member 4 isoform X2 n=1 Tax=Salarias fasciatus TaxID=181472 RepID=UPI0011767380|nr:pleckstrin homology domain-containing family A member 4 isoform X2 [Salarias fasciatus]
MELEAASRRAYLVRMEDQDRVSQASSVATISYFPVIKESDGKVQTFGKRCHAAKRDPNCPVVIRGWLNKKDSSGLKLWKRRWFVLSNYCLFYYKDSREESVLGSIPLPSYKILFCTPRECKNRKFTFKVVHQGMRSYFFSADTQEDMLGWVRALSQSAAMEIDSSLNRRCSSYQDFTQIGGSSESVDFPKSPSDEEGPSQKRRHVSRTLSEPSQLGGGRMGMSHSEQRERRGVRHRNSSPSHRTPSPSDFSRRAGRLSKEEDGLPDQNTPPEKEVTGTGSLTSRGQLGSRPHTPVGRVDIRPHDDPHMVPQTLYYAPASPQLEFKSAPSTPGAERWQGVSKPNPTYGSVHHTSSGRRPLGKASKPDPRDVPPLRPLESDADAVLTRLCGCDKLLQSLSVELAQLQMDKDSVQCALEVSRLQLEEWKSQGPRVQEDALTQKALLQEELVTIRARMCDVSLEMERVWSQYERMESELSVIRSHLQHICNFGMPQEQSQAQRELWMMEDILSGLKVNRDHFRFLLGLQRHHPFQSAAPHPGSPGSPTERLQSGLPVDLDQEPPARPPLPQELQEIHQTRDQSHSWIESPYEGIYSHAVDPVHRRGSSQPDLLNVKAQRDASESQSGSKWIPPDAANQSTKKMKMKMSEEEQIERMKRNQERLTNRKKPPLPAPSVQTQIQSSETREEAPFPLRVTRVVTAVLPSSLVARRVSVEDPPAELDTPLPEQIPPEMQQRKAEQRNKLLNKPPRRLLLDSPDQSLPAAEVHQDQPMKKSIRQQGAARASKREPRSEACRAAGTDTSGGPIPDQEAAATEIENRNVKAAEQSSPFLTPDVDPDLCLTPEQREAKLRRVERIRERVIQSAARESATTHDRLPIRGQKKEISRVTPDTARKHRMQTGQEASDANGSCGENFTSSAALQILSPASQDEDEKQQHVRKSKSPARSGYRAQPGGKQGVAKTKMRRPASPYHISSMTVYQKDGGKGFVGHEDNEQARLEEHAAEDEESNPACSDLRAKWFLSTNQWQGFIPLQIPDIETLCSEETGDADGQPASSDDMADANEMSSAVSESLEKMKENHSLFYKIACDISISDSDIPKNDGNSHTVSKPEEEEEALVITEPPPVEASSNEEAENQERHNSSQSLSDEKKNHETADRKAQCPIMEIQEEAVILAETEANKASGPEKITPPECEDSLKPESEVKVRETAVEAQVWDENRSQTQDGRTETREENSETKESADGRVDQETAPELKSTALSEETDETGLEQGDKLIPVSDSAYEARKVIRSASFAKARVTVLRTSL